MNLKTFKLNELELVDGVKAGNKRAEETLYKKYKALIFRYLRFKRYNSFDLEDCVSEILIKIFEKIKSYDSSKSSFNTWVMTITNNHIINKGRQKSIQPSILSYHTEDQDSLTYTTTMNAISFDFSVTNDISFSADANEALNVNNSHTLTMLSSLVSDKDMNMLKMKYVEGYSYNEIGEFYSMTSNTVSNRVNYIKTVIQKNKNFAK